jgi:hypothetical protein
MNILFVVRVVKFTYLSQGILKVILGSANKWWTSKFMTPGCGIYNFILVIGILSSRY